MEPRTYQEAGVDIHKADAFVTRLKVAARRKGHDRLWPACGGYASVYPVYQDLGVAMTTDGIGTKLLVAIEQKRYDTVGIDLVAMCANDLLCVGATPSTFIDYYATGALDENVSDELFKGIIEGCDQAGMLLAGGETAEMPDLYKAGDFDLAGFAMGTVSKSTLITGERVTPGDKLIAVASSGIHSNGLSLARKLIAMDSPLRKELLIPTLIYANPVVRLNNEHPDMIKGMAHITGGGWTNVSRVNKRLGYLFEDHLPVPEVMMKLAESIEAQEMYKTFNMGLGLVLIVAESDCDRALKTFNAAGYTARVTGEVTGKKDGVVIRNSPLKEGKEIVYQPSSK